MPDSDPLAESRKRDHIEMAFQAQVLATDARFNYEPLFSGHPTAGSFPPLNFLNKTFKIPLWVSSMTGGTALARTINQNLARACGEFGFGMGLGSCRQLLYSDTFLPDFQVRPLMGYSVPLFANLGVAQLEKLILEKNLAVVGQLIEKLEADGLIIHVNPMQEWLQPEGDRFTIPPLKVIETVLSTFGFPIIVKEVGQGFGPKSIRALLKLPLAALDFGAAGGTSFSKLELLRGSDERAENYGSLAALGHTAPEMVAYVNTALNELGTQAQCRQIIVSGGIQHFLDGFYCIRKLETPAIYGQASAFLKYARADYDTLKNYIESQIRGLELAEAFLEVR
jgi:isopentenyl-diphosphate Delta-isomerase